MEPSNFVDNSEEIRYNSNQDDEYEVVRLDSKQPIHDVNCEHAELIPDPNDTLGDAVMHMCANPRCGVGFYVKQI